LNENTTNVINMKFLFLTLT